SYCPVRLERRIEFPAGHVFAIAASGVLAAKTGEAMAKYNRASALARAVVEVWNEATGHGDAHMAAVLAGDDAIETADRMRQVLAAQPADGPFTPRDLLARFEQFLTENEQIVPPAGSALADGLIDEFGQFVDRSQEFAEKLLGNQVPETIHLARSARDLGAPAACSFGAGFGGSVWALIPQHHAAPFLHQWSAKYKQAFPAPFTRASFFLTRPGPSTFELARVPTPD
ncbi:MAG: galactokinase, partial [Phycisphaerae bacterium]